MSKKLDNAISFHRQGDFKQAQNFYEEILDKSPHNTEVLCLLGTLFSQIGVHEKGVLFLNKAINLDKDNPVFHNNIALILQSSGNIKKAIASFRKAISLAPDYIDAVINLAVLMHYLKEYKEAKKLFCSIREIVNRREDFFYNFANLQRDTLNTEDAITNYKKAIKIKPNFEDALFNLAMTFKTVGDIDKSINHFNKLLEFAKKPLHVKYHISQCHLLKKDFEKGWKYYESRFGGMNAEKKELHVKEYAGEDLTDKTILILKEQGIGDETMFLSLLPKLLERCCNVVYECDVRLTKIFEKAYPSVTFVETYTHKLKIDSHLPIGSLPKMFLPKLDEQLYTTPLHVDKNRQKRFSKKYKRKSKNKKLIGISYKTFANEHAKFRMPPLSFWEEIIKENDAYFLDLQFNSFRGDNEYKKLHSYNNVMIENSTDLYNNIEDLLAIIDSMDVVITIDNYIAHLAGSIGKKTYLLLASVADWRWFLEKEKTIWYPNVTIVRQDTYGDWDSVLDKIVNFV